MDETSQTNVELEIEKRRKENDDAVNKILRGTEREPGILRKSKELLTKDDIAFLKARVSYLTPMEQKEYADLLSMDTSEDKSSKLDDMIRSELDAKAVELGIKNAEKLPNRQAVIDAIREVQSQ